MSYCQACADLNDGFYGSWAPDCPDHNEDGSPRKKPKLYKLKPVSELAVGDWICSGGTKGAPEVREPIEVINISGDMIRVMREGGSHRTRFLRNIRFVFPTKADAQAFYKVANEAWNAYEEKKQKALDWLNEKYKEAENHGQD